MKILRIYTKLPPNLGGMEKHIAELTRYQLKEGIEVKIFYNDGSPISKNDEKLLPFSVKKLKPSFMGMQIFYLAVIWKLIKDKENFDVIHIHGDWSSLLFVKQLKRLTNAKLTIFSIHDQLTSKVTHQKFLPALIKNVDLVFSTSYAAAMELEQLSHKNVIAQPSGVKKIFFKSFFKMIDSPKFKIITVANLFPKKNLDLILEIAKEMSDYDFTIIGTGSQEMQLQNKIKKDNISNVNLVGFKSENELVSYYQQSNCFLLTSYREGTPTAILEAMACGLPIVTSNVGGIDNIISDGTNGFVIKTFDKKDYIEKILMLKNDLKLREKIFQSNQNLALQYKWDNVAGNITNITKDMLNAKEQ